MPEVINCPQCERKLRVPDDLRGRPVKCPTCGATFTAPAEAAVSASPPPAGAQEKVPPETYQEEGLRGASAVPDEVPAGEYQEALPRSRRRQRFHLQPHRGTLILVLGILSIVLCGFLGPVAWIMGSSDLKEIRAGRMDPEGEGTTNGGRICGIIGTFLLVLPVCCGIPAALLWLVSHRAAVHGF